MKFLALAVVTGTISPAFAHPGGHEDEYYRPAPKVAAPSATVIPDTYPGVVTALRDSLTGAETALAGYKIADLHRHCGAMKDLATAAPAKSGFLTAAEQATVASTIAHLQSGVADLVAAADKGDATGGKAAVAAIRADVDALSGFVK